MADEQFGDPAGRCPASPRDVFITVYGRKPVLEALNDPALTIDKVIVAEQSRGEEVQEILAAAAQRQIPVRRVSAHRVKVLAGNGRHDQGVLADVVAPRMRPLDGALKKLVSPVAVLVLDAITNPANVGMILRTATAAGIDGVVLPRRGVPAVDPLVIKASAGVAFHAPVLRSATAIQACATLRAAGFAVLGLSGSVRGAASLFGDPPPPRVAYVLGNETTGISPAVAAQLTGWVCIPMTGDVESLNVASAAAVVCFDWARRRAGDSLGAHRPRRAPRRHRIPK
ncbi:MAG: RNA methyltransferase [Pseudonocardiales bacterium]|nr:RNA methyltransferase [Pseudonocardiales bacterium]